MAFDADALVSAKKSTTELIQKLSQGTDLLPVLTKLVTPFSLQYQRSGVASDLVGDRAAIVFVDHLARHLDPLLRQHGGIPPDANALKAAMDQALDEVLKHDLTLRLEGIMQPVRPFSMAQLAFSYDLLNPALPLIFGIGPTGTGKTYLAIAAALNQLEIGNVRHIVITKPHEMMQGEQISPTTRAEKARDEQFNIYFDILNDFVGKPTIDLLIEQRQLEITPLGLLRGRTLTDSIILIDEAQNTNKHWMRLAATRGGKNSRTFVIGDPTHSCLPAGEVNGLSHLLKLTEGTQIGRMHKFQPSDIVRNETVAQLEALYQQASQSDVELALHRE